MRVELFGVGTKSTSPAITAQRRVNCYVDMRKEMDRTHYAVIGRPGLRPSLTTLGSQGTRGMWAVNTLDTPLLFVVQADSLISIDAGGGTSLIGTLSTSIGDVSMVDDGTFLVLVDGDFGYVYNMLTAGVLTQITDGNFTTSPRTITWLNNYFIVTSSDALRQYQMSQITPSVDPLVWPAVQIGFAGAGGGKLQNGIADHSVLNLFGDVYSQFAQETGTPDFPFAQIPGSAQQYGLAAPFSVAQFDNSLAGLFQDRNGVLTVSRLSGFGLQKMSDADIDQLMSTYLSRTDAQGCGFTIAGHPLYLLNFPQAGATHVYDGLSNTWVQYESYGETHFLGTKFAYFLGQLYVGTDQSGDIAIFDPDTYTDNDGPLVMELETKHIWNDDKYIGISQVQVDVQSGVGTVSGQGENPVVDLQVSKDGGRTFYSVGYSSMGKIGEYTQRVIWRSLGAARDWVLKLVISDPVKRVITGASCEMVGGPF